MIKSFDIYSFMYLNNVQVLSTFNLIYCPCHLLLEYAVVIKFSIPKLWFTIKLILKHLSKAKVYLYKI